VAKAGSTKNTTIKLDDLTKQRVDLAMRADGSKVYSEFVRTALIEKCRRIESQLRTDSPHEFDKIYGKTPWA
jgi:predicted transcriptional regulator